MTEQQTHAGVRPADRGGLRPARHRPRTAAGRRGPGRAPRRVLAGALAAPASSARPAWWRPGWSAVPCCSGAATTALTSSPRTNRPPTGSFVLTRPDGSTYELSDLTLSCEGPFGQASSEGQTGPQRIWMTSPLVLGADGETPEQPFLLFEGIVDKVDGRTFRLPYNSDDGRLRQPRVRAVRRRPRGPAVRGSGRTRSPAPRRAPPVPSWSPAPAATRCPCSSSRSTPTWAARSRWRACT